MRLRRPTLGKITLPDFSGLLPRDHLYRRLDDASDGKLIWICSPAGTGKTSLLAGWVQARRLPVLWYQVDAGDHDPATFFHYLGLAARPLTRARLPATTPENLMAPETFAWRYFTRLFDGLKTPHVLVLDNYQELPDDTILHRILGIVLDLLPRGSLVAIASRGDPPAALARHFTSTAMVSMDWSDLRLTEAESRELASRWGITSEDAVRLYEASDGWAALHVLLMRLPPSRFQSEKSKEEGLLFNYIGSEIFESLDPDLRQFLVKVSLPPFVTATLAERLSGRPDAGAILSRMARQNFLTTRHGEAGAERYQFHPLLRAFLLDRLSGKLQPNEVTDLRRLAALQLEKDGDAEAAAGLLGDSGDWTTLAALLCRCAPTWLAEGRVAALKHWMERLPDTVREREPWLLYWHGSLLRMIDPRLARAQLEPAWRLFRKRGEAAGAYLVWAAIVESYSAPWDEYQHIPFWLGELDELQRECPDVPDAKIEAQLVGTAKTVAICAPYSPLISHWMVRVEALIADAPSPHHIGSLALFISFKSVWRSENVARLKVLLGAIKLPPAFANNYPLSHIQYCMGLALLEAYDLNPEGCRQWVAKGFETSRTSGVHLLDTMLAIVAVHGDVVSGDVAGGEVALAEAERLLNPIWKADMVHLRYLQAGLKLMAGETLAALRLSEGLAESGEALGARFLAVFPKLLRANALAIDGQSEEALASLPEVLEMGQGFPSPWMVFQGELVEAHVRFAQGDETPGLAALSRAMAAGRKADVMIMRFWLPEFIGPLCARALNAGIEVDYVRRLIRRRGLPPPLPSIDAWPWPVRIYTLGRFAVLRDDKPLAFSGKAQKRPLQLLKALIAFGGRSVSTATLAATLWKDEVDDARHALDMTVSRLRKLLGHEAAILIHEGKISLNDKLCFVDIWAFERLAGDANNEQGAEGSRMQAAAMVLYIGAFLAGEEEESWLLPRRERLRSRYVRLVLDHCAIQERAGDSLAAIDAYQKAIEIEPLAEVLTQRLMQIHLDRGEPAQALEVFRRCRSMLSIVLGVPPAAATLALADRAKGG